MIRLLDLLPPPPKRAVAHGKLTDLTLARSRTKGSNNNPEKPPSVFSARAAIGDYLTADAVRSGEPQRISGLLIKRAIMLPVIAPITNPDSFDRQ